MGFFLFYELELKSMIIVFTGNGKGKTTAALGQAMRALGRDRKVLIIQFIKGPWISGEDEFVGRLKTHLKRYKELSAQANEPKISTVEALFLDSLGEFDIKKMGLGFVGILGDERPREDHENAAKNALKYFEEELAKEKWDLLILDEINNAIGLNLIKVEDVMPLLDKIPEKMLVVLTGRNAPDKFIERADLVTEMRELKHPFTDGKMAKIGIEF